MSFSSYIIHINRLISVNVDVQSLHFPPPPIYQIPPLSQDSYQSGRVWQTHTSYETHAAPQASVTHKTESSICLLSHTWVHKHPQLTSRESFPSPSPQKGQFSPLTKPWHRQDSTGDDGVNVFLFRHSEEHIICQNPLFMHLCNRPRWCLASRNLQKRRR